MLKTLSCIMNFHWCKLYLSTYLETHNTPSTLLPMAPQLEPSTKFRDIFTIFGDLRPYVWAFKHGCTTWNLKPVILIFGNHVSQYIVAPSSAGTVSAFCLVSAPPIHHSHQKPRYSEFLTRLIFVWINQKLLTLLIFSPVRAVQVGGQYGD